MTSNDIYIRKLDQKIDTLFGSPILKIINKSTANENGCYIKKNEISYRNDYDKIMRSISRILIDDEPIMTGGQNKIYKIIGFGMYKTKNTMLVNIKEINRKIFRIINILN